MLRYQRMVGGGQGMHTSHRTGGCGNKHKGRAHTGTHGHTPLCCEDVETGASETNAEAMGGKKRKKELEGEEERKVMQRRALGGPHTWKPRERCVLGANTQALSRERNLGSLEEGSPSPPAPGACSNALGAWPCEPWDRQELHKAEKPTAPILNPWQLLSFETHATCGETIHW